MDLLLSRVTQHAVQYAIRSGISITTGYAIKECGRLLKQAPKSREREELMVLQLRLESKIRVISPSIDMIELIAARGNTSLESAVSLTKDLRYEIQKLGQRLQNAADEEQQLRQRNSKSRSREEVDRDLKAIINQMKLLLARIEDAVPLINLAITTSGVNLSTKLSGSISPSRLLQASTFLTAADSRYTSDPTKRQQVGPTYVVTLYMLFAGHASRPADEDGVRQTTWKEVIHKARVKLWRVPLDQLYALPGEGPEQDDLHSADTIPGQAKAAEFAYQLVLVEDFDDGRFHSDEKTLPFDDVQEAGIRDVVPVHEISKVFYADTGKILNIGGEEGANNPVLLLKRDVHAEPPRRMLRRSQSQVSIQEKVANSSAEEDEYDEQTEIDAQFERESAPPAPMHPSSGPTDDSDSSLRLPADLDPEWMALEVFTEDTEDSDSDSELPGESNRPSMNRAGSLGLTSALAHLTVRSTTSPSPTPDQEAQGPLLQLSPGKRAGPPVKTSLSLLEMLMKLGALQQFRQESHLAIEDELLNFFLEDSATAGAGADKEYRQRLRHNATKRVGFDPYDESPIKRRGEEYISHAQNGIPLRASPLSFQNELAYDQAYGYNEGPLPQLDFTARPTIEHRRESTPGSPSPPHRPPYQQTPSRSSTPDFTTSDTHRDAVRAKYANGNGRSSPKIQQPLATPPSSSAVKTRAAIVRAAQSDIAKPRSPLHEVTNDDD